MKAVDTNVILRFLTLDDPQQADTATHCVGAGVFVSHSVLIETEWALRSGYGWDRGRINSELADLVVMQCVEVDQVEAIHWALDRHREGADWADMIHLIASRGHTAFSTFDQRLPTAAGNEPPLPVELLK